MLQKITKVVNRNFSYNISIKLNVRRVLFDTYVKYLEFICSLNYVNVGIYVSVNTLQILAIHQVEYFFLIFFLNIFPAFWGAWVLAFSFWLVKIQSISNTLLPQDGEDFDPSSCLWITEVIYFWAFHKLLMHLDQVLLLWFKYAFFGQYFPLFIRCNSYVKAKKKLTLLEAPNILTIVLKRFQVIVYN